MIARNFFEKLGLLGVPLLKYSEGHINDYPHGNRSRSRPGVCDSCSLR